MVSLSLPLLSLSSRMWFQLLISVFLLFTCSSFSTLARRSINIKKNSFSSSSSLYRKDYYTSPKSEAEELIRNLNLFPKQDVNIIPKGEFRNGIEPRMVEKRLNLSILGVSGPSIQDLGHHAGYYKLSDTKDARMFYFFFESRNNNNTDPVVIWLTGGPGCSSELALFYENGPYKISNNLSLSLNEFGWDKVSNLLYVDQPIGTGFSYSSDSTDIQQDETGVSNDLYNFLQAFFKGHPSYEKNDFFITGESYAGHYIPALASRVNKGNKNKEGIHINLKGFAIGNGLTDPAIQYKAYTDYALNMKLITQQDHDDMAPLISQCEDQVKQCGTDGQETCLDAYSTCSQIFQNILQIAGNINVRDGIEKFLKDEGPKYYDIRKQCEGSLCYDFSNMENFLNEKLVKEALGVGDIDFVSCSSTVYEAMLDDWMRDLEVGIPELLEQKINVLIYAGEYDLICNWLGNSRWVTDMVWSGQKAYGSAPSVTYTVDGKTAGEGKTYGPLTFLKVHNAGHMVPMDQPKASLQMLQKWTQGKSLFYKIKDQ